MLVLGVFLWRYLIMNSVSLKTKTFYQVQQFQAGIRGWIKLLSSQSDNHLSAVFIPPANVSGGIGDDAMLSASTEYLSALGFKEIAIISFNPLENWDYLKSVSHVIRAYTFREKLALVKAISSYSHIYCIGADMMDGFYSDHATLTRLNIINIAVKAGLNATILGFSFNNQPTPAAVKAFIQLPQDVRICCRDAISQGILQQKINRPVELVADVAFLLNPAQNSQLVHQVKEWIETQRANDRVVIGFNAKKPYGGENLAVDLERLVNHYADTLTQIIQTNPHVSFLLMPHDTRGKMSDAALADAIFQALPSEVQARVMPMPMPCRASEIKATCAYLDLVVTGRMHLAIASLGQGTPAAGMTYQGKFEGLFQHFGIADVTISPEEALKPDKLYEFINQMIDKRDYLRQQVQDALPEVKALAQKNFKTI